MKIDTRTLYTIEEIRTQFPDAYDKIRDRYTESVESSPDVPWSEEIMDSLKATVGACGACLNDWKIGPYSYSDMSVIVDNYSEDSEDIEERKDSAWLFDNILRPLGYEPHAERGVDFPGLCPFTGVCFDEDFIQSVYEDMQRDYSLSEALENLADVARKMMEREIEGEKDEDLMLDRLADLWFTEDGEEA